MPDPVVEPVVAPTVVPPSDTPWYTGHDAELIGHYQNKGWDKLTPGEAAKAAATAHREAERFVGVPANQLARIPKDATDEAGWNALRTQLGRPGAATDYKFDGVKFSDGSDLDQGFADTFRTLAFQSGLSQADAERVAGGFVKFLEGQSASELAESTARLSEDRAALKQNWGANYEANMLVARNTAAKLGVAPEAVNALEGQIGYKGVMDMFQKIGSQIGEDKFVSSLSPGSPGTMSRDQAVAQKAELMHDTAWVTRYLAGDREAGRQMTALNTIIVGDDTQASRAA